MNKLAKIMLEYRQDHHLSRAELSRRTGISRECLKSLEKGQVHQPRPETMSILSKEMGIKRETLWAALRKEVVT